MSNKGISVIIPNYNGVELFPKTLPAVFKALTFCGLPYEVIVSDDHSTDESVTFLQEKFSAVTVLTNKINQGFSPTINKGIFAAKYDYVLLLNSDVILHESYFIPLLRYFDKADTFGVMGRVIGWNDDLLQDTAKFPGFHGAKIKTTGNYFLEEPGQNDWLYSMYLSGANAFVDRKKLMLLQGFDEIYAPFYVEDFDLSLRAWRLGWKCYYEHFAICRHKISVSIQSKNKKNYINKIYYRNKMFLHAIHLSGWDLALWYLQLIPEILIRLVTARFYYLQSFRLFLSKKQLVEKSKQNLAGAIPNTGKLLSVDEVINKIKFSVRDKLIKRF